ncbi:twin-arginine translocation signal domain-containing protein [Paenibacillus hemerocallicola]|jgi:gluconate 2-dehydrogenase gamma chain|uniref:Twin-arginine translocation signal domain-containing protein n=1 Tax=Paenibacillus hemerocallicola TaxID=1172614 RepID=A0A5C4TB14_9BACL|nr:gluconate 2-dehydrogenase subunit 3 family protein [Paenibacillus hemerocallicola]TNJ65647.1 twin-arginine translocation signal domain-containing protein [Paenibacillus hemerocallicola]
MTEQSEQRQSNSRRRFLKYSGAAIGGAVVTGVIAGCNIGGNKAGEPAPVEKQPPAANYNEAVMFFNQAQLQITEAAAERIFPKDELGPGATELGVAFYIDHQLAGQYGNNVREYRMGPFGHSEATQGDYQSIQRHELFTMGLQAMDDESNRKHQKGFTEITDEERDAILTSMQKGDITVVTGVTGKSFFNLLRSMTMEGVYCDPVYGGNKNMMGWKMRQYPGNQMSYTSIMEKDEFVVIEPRSLHDHFAAH